MSDLRDCMIPVDPNATAMKMYSVPRGMQFIINIDGSQDRLEIVNPTDGRLPFFRLHTVEHSSDAIELELDELSGLKPHQRSAVRQEAPANKSPHQRSARPHDRSAGGAHD